MKCKNCGGPLELGREQWATPVCFACVAPRPYGDRCNKPCGYCKERTCGKAYGHQWSCNCHVGKCHADHGEKVVR